nr:serine/threonine-protein kinase [Serinicoccus sp. CUA-874]
MLVHRQPVGGDHEVVGLLAAHARSSRSPVVVVVGQPRRHHRHRSLGGGVRRPATPRPPGTHLRPRKSAYRGTRDRRPASHRRRAPRRDAPGARDRSRRAGVGGRHRGGAGRRAAHAGPWTLRERVGEGGMGVVWRADDERGREVAIKVLRSHIAHDEGARARLRREVSTLARVKHPQVAAVIDADVDGPAPYVVTDYVPGRPLDVVIEEQGPLGREALLRLARGLAGALQAIHGLGIVHRDLKPGNVLLVGEGERLEPVVIDFGIAQVADDVRLTSTGLVMGTPGYLSPELVDGGEITEATDWWGWAACLAYAASGQPPFGRGPMTVVLDRVVRGRVQLNGVDPELAPLLATALSPRPSWRPSAEEVLAAVELYARGQDVTGALPRLSQEDPAHHATAARTPPR